MNLINKLLDNLEKRGDTCEMSIVVRILNGEKNFCGCKGLTCDKCKKQAKAMLDEWRKEPNYNGWVSVEERLPETNKEVLVCNDDGKIHVALLNDEHGTEWRIKYCCYDSDIWCVDENGEIVAWYPLPAPYVKGDTNE